MRNRYVIGNWKMHGTTAQVDAFFSGLVNEKHPDTLAVQGVICPPAVYLSQANHRLGQGTRFALGAQDVSEYESGAYTGQVSAQMLLEQGCRYVIVGHSERRALCGESCAIVARKFFAAKSAGLVPILCVGETQAARAAGTTAAVVKAQLQTLLAHSPQAFEGALVAYEPVWAIGTGLSASPEDAQVVHDLLRRTIAEYDATIASGLALLYGGSVKASNVAALLAMPDIDGVLVGGASLKLTDFLAIYQAAG